MAGPKIKFHRAGTWKSQLSGIDSRYLMQGWVYDDIAYGSLNPASPIDYFREAKNI